MLCYSKHCASSQHTVAVHSFITPSFPIQCQKPKSTCISFLDITCIGTLCFNRRETESKIEARRGQKWGIHVVTLSESLYPHRFSIPCPIAVKQEPAFSWDSYLVFTDYGVHVINPYSNILPFMCVCVCMSCFHGKTYAPLSRSCGLFKLVPPFIPLVVLGFGGIGLCIT